MSAAGSAAATESQPGTVEEPAAEVAETEAPVVEGEAAPVVDPAAEPGPAVPEIPEETLKAAAEKYAADAVKQAAEKAKQANSAMAAARRAEARTEAVKAENKTLTTSLGAHQDFVSRLQKGDHTALAQIGFPSLRAFLDACATGGASAERTPADDLAELRREREADKATAAAQRVEGVKGAVKTAIEAQKDKYVRAATTRGHREIWDAIEAYNELHGTVPDEAIFAIADRVEASLRKEFGEPSSATRPAANNGALPAKGTGKTITSKGAAGAPGSQELSMDPDIRREQVTARMRAGGEL